MHDSLCETLCFHSADKRDVIPHLQMKDIYMIAYFRINVPTAGERDM